MAFIRGNVIQDEVENFNPIRDENIDNEFSNNEFFQESGFTFEDILSLLNNDGEFYRLDFGGRSVIYQRDSNGDAVISGGLFTGFKESFLSGSTWVERYAAAGFSFSAKDFYAAVMSTTRSDDIRVIQSILSGNDVLSYPIRMILFAPTQAMTGFLASAAATNWMAASAMTYWMVGSAMTH
jgi:hypothetical protein